MNYWDCSFSPLVAGCYYTPLQHLFIQDNYRFYYDILTFEISLKKVIYFLLSSADQCAITNFFFILYIRKHASILTDMSTFVTHFELKMNIDNS